jgi:hypothetical protein
MRFGCTHYSPERSHGISWEWPSMRWETLATFSGFSKSPIHRTSLKFTSLSLPIFWCCFCHNLHVLFLNAMYVLCPWYNSHLKAPFQLLYLSLTGMQTNSDTLAPMDSKFPSTALSAVATKRPVSTAGAGGLLRSLTSVICRSVYLRLCAVGQLATENRTEKGWEAPKSTWLHVN